MEQNLNVYGVATLQLDQWRVDTTRHHLHDLELQSTWDRAQSLAGVCRRFMLTPSGSTMKEVQVVPLPYAPVTLVPCDRCNIAKRIGGNHACGNCGDLI